MRFSTAMLSLLVFRSPGSAFFLPLTLIRIVFGGFYFTAGFNKLFNPSNQVQMLTTITEAGIPFPEFMAVFVSINETLFGLLLAIGLLTRISSLSLLIISLVALFTVGLGYIPDGLNLLTWYSWLLYLPEPSYLLMSIILLVQGCGPWGVDRVIAHRFSNAKPYQESTHKN